MAEPNQAATPPPAEAPLLASYELGDATHEPEFDEPTPGRQERAQAVTPQPATPPVSVPTHKQHVVQAALDLGFSDEEIRESEPNTLERAVWHAQRAALTRQQQNARQDTLLAVNERPPQERNGAGPTEVRSAAQPAPSPATNPNDEALPGINEEEYDPGLIGIIKTLCKQNKALEQRLNGVHDFQQARVKESIAAQCDRTFERHEAILGKGRGQDMKPDDPHYLRRKAVLQLVDSLPQQGTLADRIDRAIGLLYGTQATQPASEPTTRDGQSTPPQAQRPRDTVNGRFVKPDEWSAATLARPTQRNNSAEPPGEQKAMRTAAALMRDQGLMDDSDPSAEDFLE